MNDHAGSTDVPLLVTSQDGLRILTLNRPERLNALTPELHHLLRDAVLSAASDPAVRALVLAGAGGAFCSGGDVRRGTSDAAKAVRPETVEERADSLRRHGETTLALSRMPKPTIALVQGAAAGAGLTLALACDLRFGSPDLLMRTAYAGVALAGDLGITYFLQTLVGRSRAFELMLLNEKIDAARALEFGLVNRILPADGFAEAGLDIARRLAEGPSVALRYMKQNINLAETGTLEQVIERESYNAARCLRTQDMKEAALAFREKRKPVFQGL